MQAVFMNRKVYPFIISLCLLLIFVRTSAQPSIDKYAIVKLKGSIIKNTLEDYSGFAYFDFTYVQSDNNIYSLEGYARDKNNNQLGNLIILTPQTNHPVRRFKNLEKGHLYLTLETMQDHNVDGSEDYILTPRKCKDRDGNLLDYVSYRFSNKVKSSFGFIQAKYVYGVRAFDLNPSPPALSAMDR